jgi:hypothetical protein
MIKEIKKEKILNIDTYNNIKAMIKSSNEEDFFIGIEAWVNINPPDILTTMMMKHSYRDRYDKFEDKLKSTNKWPLMYQLQRTTWPGILNTVTTQEKYKPYRDIISQEFNAYINQKLLNEGLGHRIKPIKTEIKWQN